MIKYGVCSLFFISVSLYSNNALVIRNTNIQKMGIYVAYIGQSDTLIADIATYIARDLSYSEQFYTQVTSLTEKPSRADITDLCKKGYQFALIMNHASN